MEALEAIDFITCVEETTVAGAKNFRPRERMKLCS